MLGLMTLLILALIVWACIMDPLTLILIAIIIAMAIVRKERRTKNE